MIKEIDVMVFDLQDIGTRVYTYVSSWLWLWKVALNWDWILLFWIAPNPIGGEILEGAVLKYPEFSSFVGLYPILIKAWADHWRAGQIIQ